MTAWGKQCGATARKLAQRVAWEHGFTFEEIRSARRYKALSRARFAVMHALAMTGAYSKAAIGKFLDRDRSGVYYGVNRHAELADEPRPPKLSHRPPTRGKMRAAAERRALHQRLLWQYGARKAAIILAGNDPATQADIAAWNGLGAGA